MIDFGPMRIIVCVLSALVIYCYLGYPLIIYLLAKLKSKPLMDPIILPSISIVISLHNEADVISRKIVNLLEVDYPVEKMDIWIGSDGSTDRTNEIIKAFSDPRIHLVINAKRQGKMHTISELVAKSNNEIIVFNDARQILDKDTIRKLVLNFGDPQVGCVSGELVLSSDGSIAKGIDLYWEYEKFIRNYEGQVHSVLGATGPIYAIRRKLFVKGPDDVVLDDVFIPFKIIEQGFRSVYEPTAMAYDKAADNPKEEYCRKARTLYGNYQIFTLFPQLFNLFKSPIAIQLFSHKLLRVILPFVLVAIFIFSLFGRKDIFIFYLLTVQAIFYFMAIIGALVCNRKGFLSESLLKFCYLPYMFCLLNYLALVGFFRFIRSNQGVQWDKARERRNCNQQQDLIG